MKDKTKSNKKSNNNNKHKKLKILMLNYELLGHKVDVVTMGYKGLKEF